MRLCDAVQHRQQPLQPRVAAYLTQNLGVLALGRRVERDPATSEIQGAHAAAAVDKAA